jgi:hypothetical protein
LFPSLSLQYLPPHVIWSANVSSTNSSVDV